MSSVVIRKELGKVGKRMLRQLSSYVEKYVEVEKETEVIDPISGEIEKRIEHTYEVKKVRLSKSQILQVLYYHFLPIDERGVIRAVSEKQIAEDLNITIRTVRNNNILLEEANVISYSRSIGNTINILLENYQSYFLQNGSGYLTLTFDRLKELSDIEHVNSLRTELREELIYDNNEAKRQYKRDHSPSVISFNDFKTFAPKYTHYQGMVKSIVEKGTSAFKVIVKDSAIFFEKNESYKTGKEIKELRTKEYNETITSCIQSHKVQDFFTKEHIEDFIQLSFEYSIDRLLPALEELITQQFYEGAEKPIHNFGGKVRTIIRQHLQNESQIQAPAEFIA